MKSLPLVALLPSIALAQHSIPAIEVTNELEEEKVIPNKLNRAKYSNDTATLLKNEAGVSIRSNGEIASQPTIHGLSNDRVNITIDDVGITPSCPNHMNPALSYIDPEKIQSLETMAGITPVSYGGDSIGGSIVVKTKQFGFAEKGEIKKKLSATTFYKSNNDNVGASLGMGIANDKYSFFYEGLDEKANRYKDGNGDQVKGTIYNQNNQSLTLARKLNSGVLAVKYTHTNVPFQGFVNQYMDMTGNEADAVNLSYDGKIGNLIIETNASFQHTEHEMNILQSERSGNMPMNTSADEFGYHLKASYNVDSKHLLKFGGDYNQYRLEDWWPAVSGSMMMGPNTFQSIHNGARDRIGLFAEDWTDWNSRFSTVVGFRTDLIRMNADTVHGYNETNNSPADANAFNAKDRAKFDRNWDATLLAKYMLNPASSVEVGYARKTRSPNLYERYAWAGTVTNNGGTRMDMRMINWFGDGNGYVGNVNLNPEVAHTLSASYKINESKWNIAVTPYASYVKDFIDADVLYENAGINYLQFNNHDAVLIGVDLAAGVKLVKGGSFGDLDLNLAADYTRGYRKDGKADLYQLMPLNGRLSLVHSTEKWQNQLGLTLVNDKKQVNNLRREVETPGYALVDIASSWQFTKQARIELAVTNLLDKTYTLPLGGIDLINNGSDKSTGLLGMGRSINTSLKLDF